MKTKLLHRLRRLARRKIKIEYSDEHWYSITIRNKLNKYFWNKTFEKWTDTPLIINKKDIINEYKNTIRIFILTKLKKYKIKRGNKQTKQLNKKLQCNKLNH